MSKSIKLLYFAWVRERIGLSEEIVTLPQTIMTIHDLIDWLITRDERYSHAFENADIIRVAIDQIHANHTSSIGLATEIAFFPPMTGG